MYQNKLVDIKMKDKTGWVKTSQLSRWARPEELAKIRKIMLLDKVFHISDEEWNKMYTIRMAHVVV